MIGMCIIAGVQVTEDDKQQGY